MVMYEPCNQFPAASGIAPLVKSGCLFVVMIWSLSACATQESASPAAVPPTSTMAQPVTAEADTAPVPTNHRPVAAAPECIKKRLFQVGRISAWQIQDRQAFFFLAGMTIAADGAPDAYHPTDIGTDALGNAGRPGNWWALVTDNGEPSGKPLVQKADDPKPGFYISATALEDRTRPTSDPRRFVDSNTIPYLVLPSNNQGGARLGDFGVVINRANGRSSPAIFADLGPKNHLGEGSIALAERLGIPSNPRRGGVSKNIVYVVFPGSGNGKPRTLAEIEREGAARFAAWGGQPQLDACLP